MIPANEINREKCGNCGKVRRPLVRLQARVDTPKGISSISQPFCSVECAEVFLEGHALMHGMPNTSYFED